MSSKQSCFKAIIKSDLRRSWWLGALAALFIFMSSTTYLFSSYDFSSYRYRLSNAVGFAKEMGFSFVIGMFLSAFCALFIFSYLNKVNSVSFFHSLPITRNKILLAHILSSAVIIISPMLLNSIISLFAVNRGVKASWVLFTLLAYIVYSFVIFSVTLVVSMLCGSSIAAGVFTPVAICLPAFIITFARELCSGYLYGFASGDSFEMLAVEWIYLSPEYLYSPKILVYVGIIIVFTILAFVIYNKRHLENHGEVIAFTGLKGLFKVLFGLCAGVLGYYYFDAFWDITSILTMLVFGAVGTVIAHMLSNKSFSLRGVWKSLSVTCGIIIVLFVSFFFDLFGYENRMPDIDDVEHAEITDLYYEEYYWFEDELYHSYEIRAVRKDPYKPYFASEEEIRYFLDIHSYAIEHKSENDDCDDDFITPRYPDYERDYFSMEYHLKDGSIIKRQYRLPSDELEKMTEKIYNTDTYRKWKYPVLDGTEKKYTSVEISDKRTYYNTTESYAAQTDEAKRIIDALIKDRADITYDRMRANEYGGMVEIKVTYTVPYVSEDGKEYFRVKNDTYSVGNSDVNTWALLDELDVFDDERFIEPSDIKNVGVSFQEYFEADEFTNDVYSEISYAELRYDRPVATAEHYEKYDYNTKIFEEHSDIATLFNLYYNHHNGVTRPDDDVVVFYLSLYMHDGVDRHRTIVMNVSDLPEVLSYFKITDTVR